MIPAKRRVEGDAWQVTTSEHAPQTDPAIYAETATHRSDRIPLPTGEETATLEHEKPATHNPHTDPAGEESSGSRKRSEAGPALRRIGEGSVYQAPQKRRQAKDSDTDEMHAVRRQTSSALRPSDGTQDVDGMGRVAVVLILTVLAVAVAVLIWILP